MKRFFYNYLCLIVALAMTGWFWAVVYAFAVPKYMNDELWAIIIGVLALLIVILLIDAPLRDIYGMKNKVLMIILSLIITPIRFFCQLVTVILLHIAHARGDRNFAKRKDYSYNSFGSCFMYLLFNTTSLSVKSGVGYSYTPKKKIKKEKKVRISKKEKQRQAWDEIQSANKKRIEEVALLRGNVSMPTVYILPMVSNGKDCGVFGMYEGRWNSAFSTEEKARITRLYVNGVDYTYYDGVYRNYCSCLGLYLKSGTYDFKVEFELKIVPPIDSKNQEMYKVKKNLELNGIKVNSNGEVYLGLVCGLNYYYNEVKNTATGEKHNEHLRWGANSKFLQLSAEEINGLDPDWRKGCVKLDGSIPKNCLVV